MKFEVKHFDKTYQVRKYLLENYETDILSHVNVELSLKIKPYLRIKEMSIDQSCPHLSRKNFLL